MLRDQRDATSETRVGQVTPGAAPQLLPHGDGKGPNQSLQHYGPSTLFHSSPPTQAWGRWQASLTWPPSAL